MPLAFANSVVLKLDVRVYQWSARPGRDQFLSDQGASLRAGPRGGEYEVGVGKQCTDRDRSGGRVLGRFKGYKGLCDAGSWA